MSKVRALRPYLFAVLAFLILFGIFFLPASLLALWFRHPLEPYLFFVLCYTGFLIFGQMAILRGRGTRAPPAALSWALHAAFGIGITISLYALIAWTVDLLPIVQSSHFNTVRAFLVLAASAFTCVVGYLQAIRGPNVVRVDVAISKLPPAFRDLKILQISDLHVGHTIDRAYVARVVQKSLPLNADLIALTGDFADGTVDDLRSEVAPLAELHARYGKYFISGNHEYYWGVDPWLEEHRRLGARVLVNEHVVIAEGQDRLVIAGVTDHMAGSMKPGHESSAAQAFSGAPVDAVRILLAHQPVSFRQALKEDVQLQLSGHTHGGQWFPARIAVRVAQKYLAGLYRTEGLWIYVSRGTGYWGPPLRFLVPSEITLLTLKNAE